MLALLGKKLGMTQFVNAEGHLIPATVLEAGPCVVTAIKNEEKHGYRAVQIGYGDVKEKHLTKSLKTIFQKGKLPLKKNLKEVRLTPQESYELGQEIKVDLFKSGDVVDVQGTSIGKGFAGGMKRWGWRGGPGSHGSMFHRRIGSVGASSFPSRTWPGHKMPGHMGHVKKNVQNLEVLKVDVEKNLMLVKGAVPGSGNSLVFIRKSLKMPGGVKQRVVVRKSEKKGPLAKGAKKTADTEKK
ncbi:MAG: 50S ribosomal protein L3 [Omnitrophica bacterium RIFCSPHIGHO2_02_FULL_51_18]|nr:MAG: 50S ribosomal protein L3 [Omnitrophica bacterium RIFCSPHIGHO2_02_FULL_51_18]